MGLALAEENASGLRSWGWPLLLAVLVVACEAADLAPLLRWDRAGVAGGESWRLVSGHLAHLGWAHLAMNLLGLGLVWLLAGSAFTGREWALVLALAVSAIDAGFWWMSPALLWYVGLSGVLHAMLAAGAMATVVRDRERRLEALVLLALLSAKLAYEQLAGPMPGSSAAAGGPVVVDAHFYGALGGVVAALVLAARPRRRD